MGETCRTSLFVTGTPRSGTTLVDKLLSQHAQIKVFSQPLPLLFVETKRSYLQERNPEDVHRLAIPLGDLVGNRHAEQEGFETFLSDHRVSPGTMEAIVARQRSYSGCYTLPPENWQPDRTESTLHHTWLNYCADLQTSLTPDSTADILGSKETFCEEYIPYFLSEDTRVVLVIRDPRDAICSANTGRGEHHAGERRPLLFSIRQWRKSVEYALAYEDHPNLTVVRYEQLVAHPTMVMGKLYSFLAVPPFNENIGTMELRDLDGKRWQSNSSHNPGTRVSTDSIGRFRTELTQAETDLIQCTCFAEMKCLNYELDLESQEVEGRLRSISLDEGKLAVNRAHLRGYRFSQSALLAELKRWRALRNLEPPEPTQFVFEENFSRLSAASSGSST